MSSQPFKVRYGITASPYYADLPSVTGISYNTGRVNVTDNWSGSTAVIYGRNPSSITSPPVIGAYCALFYNDTTGTFFAGIVQDWRIIYGSIPALDTYELTLESGWGAAGRRTATITTTSNASTYDMAVSIQTNVPFIKVGIGSASGYFGWGSTTSAQTITGQLANALTLLMQTEQGFITDQWDWTGNIPSSVYTNVWGRNAQQAGQATDFKFTDATSLGVYDYRYTELQFLSAAYNYGTVVNVDATGFATQTSGSGYYAQNYSTINGSASEAANLAGYVKAELDLASAVPYRLTTTWAATASQTAIGAQMFASTNIHKSLQITFRGNTYNCLIEGFTFQASPDNWIITYNLSSSLQNAFLRLNNTVFGTLDNNRLGF